MKLASGRSLNLYFDSKRVNMHVLIGAFLQTLPLLYIFCSRIAKLFFNYMYSHTKL